MSSKIPVGISACLMGEKVRFDGGHKRLTFAMDDLASFVAFTAICPEMAIGLPAPRPALRLVKNPNDHIALRTSKETSPVDYTASMEGGIRAPTGASARRSLRLHCLRQIAELRYGAGAGI